MAQKPTPETVAYTLERAGGNMWRFVTLVLKGDTVIRRIKSAPDTYEAARGRFDIAVRQVVA
jgi:predicted Mrr-cat superfamily restriction endonuclease